MADVDGRTTGNIARERAADAEDILAKAYGSAADTTRAVTEKAVIKGRKIAEISLSCIQENIDAAFDAAIEVQRAKSPINALSKAMEAAIASSQRSATQGRRIVETWAEAAE